jgi:hypothetical protein
MDLDTIREVMRSLGRSERLEMLDMVLEGESIKYHVYIELS